MDIWKVFQTITLTDLYNFALVKIALNQLPGGPDGPDPPDGAGAAGVHLGGGPRIRSSSGGQDKAIDTPTTLLPILQVQILQDKTTMAHIFDTWSDRF